MTSDAPSPDQLLARLDRQSGANWALVAETLVALEAHSRINPDGQLWVDVLAGHLEKIGHGKSMGHLRKIRRAYLFFQSERAALGPEFDAVDPGDVWLTSLEIAERLFKLDRADGHAALRAALEGASPAELQARYEQAKIDHADQLSPSQLAWKTKRKPTAPSGDLPQDRSAPDQPGGERAQRHDHDFGAQPHDAPSLPIAQSARRDPAFWWGLAQAQVEIFAPGKLRDYLAQAGAGFLVIGKTGERIIGGMGFLDASRATPQNHQRILERACFHARFFDQYWLLLDMPQARAKRLWDDLADAGVTNISLACCARKDSAELGWSRRAQGAPCPDQRHILVNALLARSLRPG
jgi:hypothetical protein